MQIICSCQKGSPGWNQPPGPMGTRSLRPTAPPCILTKLLAGEPLLPSLTGSLVEEKHLGAGSSAPSTCGRLAVFTGRKPRSFKLWVPGELLLPASVSFCRQDGRPLSLLGSGPPLGGSSPRRALWSWPVVFQKVRKAWDFYFALPTSGKRKADRPNVLMLALEPCPPVLCFRCGGGGPPKRRPELAEAARPLTKDSMDAASRVRIHSSCFLWLCVELGFFPNYRVSTRLKRNIKSKFIL